MVAEEAAEAADATAGSLKISAKKRRQVGSPLLVLSETLHTSLLQSFEHPQRTLKPLWGPTLCPCSIPDHFMERNICGFGQKIACLFPESR